MAGWRAIVAVVLPLADQLARDNSKLPDSKLGKSG